MYAVKNVFSAQSARFLPLVTAEFGNQTVLDFYSCAWERAFRDKIGRTGRRANGFSRREWCFCCFF